MKLAWPWRVVDENATMRVSKAKNKQIFLSFRRLRWKSKAFSSAFSQGWRRIWYNTNGYCLRKAGKNESFNIGWKDCDWVRHIPKIKAKRDCKKDWQISRKCFKGNPNKQNNCTGRTSFWKGLSLCRRVQNKRTMRKRWMLKAVCSLPRIRLPGTLFKIQQYTLLNSFKTAVCL